MVRYRLHDFELAAVSLVHTASMAEDASGSRHLLYPAPYGLTYPLANRQPNDTWAALIVAGLREDLHEAMAQAEWAVSRTA